MKWNNVRKKWYEMLNEGNNAWMEWINGVNERKWRINETNLNDERRKWNTIAYYRNNVKYLRKEMEENNLWMKLSEMIQEGYERK